MKTRIRDHKAFAEKKSRIITAVSACLLIAALGIGGVFAYLMDETEWLDNDIELGNIAHGEEFTITETAEGPFIAIPGEDIIKDPVVVADATDENVDSYVFLRVSPGMYWDFSEDDFGITMDVGDVEKALETGVTDEWTYLCEDGEYQDKVYYQELSAGSKLESHVLVNDKITVSEDITIADLEELTYGPYLDMNFRCYTIQQAGFDDIEEAYYAVRGAPMA